MNKLGFIIISCSLLSSMFFSCDDDTVLNEKIDFFSRQERDSLIVGSWKSEASKGNRFVEVVDFLHNGRYNSNMGTLYIYYYTQNGKLYLLRTSKGNNPGVMVMDYKLNQDKDTLTLTFEGLSSEKMIYVKL